MTGVSNRLAGVRQVLRALGMALWLLAAAGGHGGAQAGPATDTQASAPPVRPRVALVLSGGGARGFAHIGVLRVLHELRVPVDSVWGTSMGAVIGGAYAAGRDPDQLLQLVHSTDWDGMFDDRLPRDALTQRRRDEDLVLPSRVEFALSADGLSLPPATAGNAALELALARLLPEGMHQRPSHALPTPFGSVASDLLNGDLVNQWDTPVMPALRASLSVPGVFSPVRVRGRLLVDGGVVRNLPVDLARQTGADVVIAVNVGTPLGDESELGSSLGVMRQVVGILTEQNVTRSLAELGPRDILLTPDLSGVGFLAFKAHERAVAAGEAAARAVAERLRPLALAPQAWSAHMAGRDRAVQLAAAPPLPLGTVTVQGTHRLDAQALAAAAGLEPGKPISTEGAHEAAARLYADGHVTRVEVQVQDRAGQRDVRLDVAEAEWARSRLRLGLELSSDFGDSSAFNVAAMHVLGPLNRLGGELRSTVRIGSRRELATEFWQPLGAGSAWFASASLDYRAAPQDAFDEGGVRAARLSTRSTELLLALGRRIADWGEVRLGVQQGRYAMSQLLPQGGQTSKESGRMVHAQLRADTLDSLGYPTAGHLLGLQWSRPLGREPGEEGTSRVLLQGLQAYRVGPWSGHVYIERGRAAGGAEGGMTLGGFWRLTGLEADALQGSAVAFGRLVVARELSALPPVLGRAVRAGLSLEAGNVFATGEPVRVGAMRRAASLFLSADTRFGPTYLALGASSGLPPKLYLFLGPIW